MRSRSADERGYLMVGLLVAISVMGIMMAAAMPAWHTMVQREKEAELVFRGEQIARAIGLYQRRFANAPAPSIDFLVEQRFLRKKYKDPIANDDFQVLTSGTNQPGQIQGRAQGAAPTTQATLGRGQGSGSQQATGRAGAAGSAQGFGSTTATGGVIGVASKSPLKSLRLYNGQDVYNQWVFMPVARAGGPGGPAGGRGADGRGAGAGGGGRGQGGTPQGRGGTPQGQGGTPQGQGGRGGFQLPPPARGRF